MASLFSRERQPVCQKEDCSPFDIGTVYRVIACLLMLRHFRLFPTSKETLVWKALKVLTGI